jgi:hypothetical protein
VYKPDECTGKGKKHFSLSKDNPAILVQSLTFGEEIRVHNILGMRSAGQWYVLLDEEVHMPIVSNSYDTSY